MKRAVIRLPSEVVDRLDQLARELNAARPGRRFSRASVVRVLLARGFGVVEADREQLAGPLEGEPVKRGRKARCATPEAALTPLVRRATGAAAATLATLASEARSRDE